METVRLDRRYTYADYYRWDDGKRYELVDGQAYLMEPAPAWGHQGVSVELEYQIKAYLKGRPERMYHAPFDVRLNADAGDDTVLQPDIVVFCDSSKLSGTGCIGAPDMVVEILSPYTASRDNVLKFNRYLLAGVREYWIVDPDARSVQACVLNHGGYDVKVFTEADRVPVHILDGCVIDLAEVFE